MSSPEDQIEALQAALSATPDNAPLRRHLADVLAQYGRHREAADEFTKALKLDPDNNEIKLALAQCFLDGGQASHAHVLVDALLKQSDTPAQAYVIRARLLLREDDVGGAARAYGRGLDADPSIEDEALSERLGMGTSSDEINEVADGRLRQSAESPPDGPASEVERPSEGFESVGGMDDLKQEIALKIIEPMKNPGLFAAYGKKIGGGILLYGPPGCGKTHIARATAGEVDARFISVGISDVLDMWIGQSERNLRSIFEQARDNQPCVLFFDEVDALGAKRSDMRQSAGRNLINQFLSELDGFSQSNDGLLVLAATNAPWHLDSAFRRPGRFDRIVFVPPPDDSARAAIFALELRGKPLKAIDYDHLAKKTAGLSGADIKGLVDRAVEAKLREAVKTGSPTPITTKDLLKAAKAVRPSTKDWFGTARNHALYANQSGLYDDVLSYLGER